MSDMRPVLLLTRPEPGSQRVIDQLDPKLRGQVDVVVSPLMRIDPTQERLALEPWRGVIFSSAHGVAAVSGATDRRVTPAYCVGAATTRAARRAGWDAQQMGGTADELVASLLSMRPVGPLVHLRGQHTRGDIAERLTAGGIPCQDRVVYFQYAEALSDEACDLVQGARPVILPLFSPRTATLFFRQSVAAPLMVAALSAAVAAEVPAQFQASTTIAATPDARSMTVLLEKLMRSAVAG